VSLAEDWTAWLAANPDRLPLDEACTRIAAEEGSGATLGPVRDALDALAAGARIPPGAAPVEQVARLVHRLFVDEDFHGEVENYDDPRNSCIDVVLATQRGLPILLSVITIEVGRRAGVELDLVGFPGHFLVGTRTAEPRFFVDPFRRGLIRRRDELGLDLTHRLGRPVPPAELDRALAPTEPRDVLLRMSNNLLRSWLSRGDLAGALRNAERRVGLRPEVPELHRDRGLLRARLGDRTPAAHDLQHYLAERPTAPDAAKVSWQLSMLLT
jgi:regulator of sirC expression with transglutaminase-like and TPR domain